MEVALQALGIIGGKTHVLKMPGMMNGISETRNLGNRQKRSKRHREKRRLLSYAVIYYINNTICMGKTPLSVIHGAVGPEVCAGTFTDLILFFHMGYVIIK